MSNHDPHSVRLGETPPDFTSLYRGAKGQLSCNVAFRKGPKAEAYIKLREWCWYNEVNWSDIFNSLIEPLLSACLHFSHRDTDDQIVITLNLGDVALDQAYAARRLGVKGHPGWRRKKNGPKPLDQTKYSEKPQVVRERYRKARRDRAEVANRITLI